MPSHRRSSRLTDRRCSLQSLVLEDQPRRSARTPPKQQQQQQPRRSKRIQEQNAKKNQSSLSLPASPVSTLDTPSSNTISHDNDPLAALVPKMASLSVITPIKTPSKSLGVRFGNNSVAKFSCCDPPMHIERLSPNALVDSSEEEEEEEREDDESSWDDETKRNCHILAQWDDSFDELEFVSSSEGVEAQWRDAKVIVEEEEDIVFDENIMTCPNVSHRSNARPTKRVDEYFCKSCGYGMRRTTRYVYEED
eukprot:scaffold5436_cov143-Skeletonema_menzelii.AAC.4